MRRVQRIFAYREGENKRFLNVDIDFLPVFSSCRELLSNTQGLRKIRGMSLLIERDMNLISSILIKEIKTR